MSEKHPPPAACLPNASLHKSAASTVTAKAKATVTERCMQRDPAGADKRSASRGRTRQRPLLRPPPSSLLAWLRPQQMKWMVCNCRLAKPAARHLLTANFSRWQVRVPAGWPRLLPPPCTNFLSPSSQLSMHRLLGGSPQLMCKLHLRQALIFCRIPPP